MLKMLDEDMPEDGWDETRHVGMELGADLGSAKARLKVSAFGLLSKAQDEAIGGWKIHR